MNVYQLPRYLSLGIKHPTLACQKLRERWHVAKVRRSLYSSLDGAAPGPLTVGMNLTFMCNLRCKMCGQYGDQGVYHSAEREFLHQRLSIEELRAIVDDVAPYRPDFFLWGGEPLLHPSILELVRYIKSKGLICTINTNGTLLESTARALVEAGLDGLDVSLCGPEELHDEITRVKGAMSKALKGIRAIARRKLELGRSSPMVKVVCTLSETNYARIREFIEALEEEEAVELICIALGWFTSEEIGKRYEEAIRKAFGCDAPSWRGFVNACGKPDPAAVGGLVKWAGRRRSGPVVVFFPSVAPQDMETYFTKPDVPVGKTSCVAPWLSADVRPNGDVTFCPDFPDYIVGNVKRESFMSIWNGSRARTFREVLGKKRLFPICARCCGLYSY